MKSSDNAIPDSAASASRVRRQRAYSAPFREGLTEADAREAAERHDSSITFHRLSQTPELNVNANSGMIICQEMPLC